MRTLDPRGPAHDIVLAPDTADVFVTYWQSGVVARIRTGGARVLWRRTVGTEVHHLAFDAFNGRRLWATDRAGPVLLLSARTGRRCGRFGGCPGPHHVAIASARSAVVACNSAGTLAVFDASAGLIRTIPVGAGPHGVAIAFVP